MPYYRFTPPGPLAHDEAVTVNAGSEWSARNLLMTNGIDLDRVYHCEIVQEAELILPDDVGITWEGSMLDMSGRLAAQAHRPGADR